MGLLIGIYLIYQSYKVFKQDNEDVDSFILWFFLGLIILVTSAYLDILDRLSQLLRMEKNPYTVFTLAIFLLFVIVFKLYARIGQLKTEITRLNEAISIEKYKEGKKD